jgi:hypothetical protein
MAAKLTILTHKIAIQPHLVAESCVLFAILAPGCQSGNFWTLPLIDTEWIYNKQNIPPTCLERVERWRVEEWKLKE